MKRTTIISIKVITNSPKNAIVGKMADGTIKVRIKAKPIQGKANEALVSYLSEELNIPKSKLAIISGEKSRRKTLQIIGLNEKDVFRRLLSDDHEP